MTLLSDPTGTAPVHPVAPASPLLRAVTAAVASLDDVHGSVPLEVRRRIDQMLRVAVDRHLALVGEDGPVAAVPALRVACAHLAAGGPQGAHLPRPAARSRPGPRRHPSAGPEPSGGRTTAPYLVPEVPEVAALLGAAERVLVACGRAEDAHADRAVRLAAAVDPGTLPVQALVGPGLPVPLARRIAFRALQRLAVALRPALRPETRAWPTTDGGSVVAFRAVRVDTTDLAILGQTAAQLTHPRRTREGTLGGAVESLGSRSGEPPEHRHPAALGCLLA